MIEIFITWIILGIVFSGVGALAAAKLTRPIGMLERWFAHFWIGWCLVIGFLQIWHFFFKVNLLVCIFVGIAGITGLVLSRKEIFSWVRSTRFAKLFIFALLTGIFGLWLANRALVPSSLFDSAAYHMQTVMWFSAYPIIPGLGNLQYRFAFNNSSFLYSAMTDVLYWNQRSYHVGNSLLIFMLVLQALVSFYRLITAPSKRPENLFMVLMFFPAVITAYDFFYVTYSPDIPVFILGILLADQLLRFLFNAPDHPENWFRVLMIALLSFTGMTVKLSFVGLAAPAMLVTIAIWFYHRRTIYQPLLGSAVLGVIFLVPWMIRGIILSGYIAFPVTFGAVPVEWRIPEYVAIDASEWIKSWARLPDQHWGIVNYSNAWLFEWIQKVPGSVITPVLMSLFFFILAAFLSLKSKTPLLWKKWLFFLVPGFSIIFWFISAPDVRFAGASFWILAFGAASLAFSLIDCPENDPAALRGLSIAAIIALFIFPIPGPILLPHFRLQAAPADFERLLVNVETRTTNSGLKVHLPPTGYLRCWKIPIPCLPSHDPYLELIDEHDMAKGFKMSAQMPYPIQEGFSASPGIVIRAVSGWSSYDSENRVIWMASPSRFLFYVAQPGLVELHLTPGVIQNSSGPGTVGEVLVRVDNKLEKQVSLQSSKNALIDFRIGKGYHLVELINPQGNFIPKEVDAKSEDDDPHSISFSKIQVNMVR